MPLFLGQLVSDRYRVDALLDQDDTGALYQIFDMNLNIPVAFIENPNSSAEATEQFSREAELLTRLSHSNLPRVFDHFTLPGQGQYLVMDLVTGEDLHAMVNRMGVLPQADTLDWMAQVSEAMTYLRSKADMSVSISIEPADVVIREDGRVTLMGFDLIKRHTPGKTAPSERGITPGYSAPEQYGHGEADERSDVYTIGAMLYHLLTGQAPAESIQLATGSARLIVPSQLNPEVSPGVQQLILNAMSPDAGNRHQSLGELQRDLLAQKFGTGEAVPGSSAQEASEQGVNKMWPVILGGLGFVLGIILVSVVYFSFLGSSTPDDETAEQPVTPVAAQATALSATPTTAVVDFPTPTTPPDTETLSIEVPAESAVELPSPGESLDVPAVEVISDPATGAPMVWVPGGPFIMGGPSGSEDGQFTHEVTLDDFYIDQYEVTNNQYAACVAAGGCQPPANLSSYTRDAYYGNPEFGNYPVLQVSWDQSSTFCAWRGGQLPTEAEWEKAARGTDQRTYPWGEGLDCSLANWATSSGTCVGDTVAAGTYAKGSGPFGTYDMAGNVWEWVSDWYAEDYYAESPVSNPRGPESGEFKVLRGGSWVSNELNVRTTFRNSLEPASTSSNIGFRCVQR